MKKTVPFFLTTLFLFLQAAGGSAEPALTRAPELITFVEAEYPEEEVTPDEKKTIVKLILTLNEQGDVTDAVVSQSGGKAFDEAAVKAAKQFKFSPAEVDNKPSAIRIEYVYTFVMKKAAPKTGSISGVIIQKGVNRYLKNVRIQLIPQEDQNADPVTSQLFTDKNGKFQIQELPVGKYSLTVFSPHHSVFETEEVVSENEEIKVKYFISPLKFGSYETVVTASVNEKEVTRRKLSREEIRYLPGTQGDIIKVLQNLPGVSRGSFGDGRLVIRGTAPQDSKTYLNGIEIPAIFHFGGLRSVIATQMVEDVEYMGGGYSSRYGNSIGGVVDIKLKHQNPDHWRSWVGVDTFDAGFYTEGPVSEKASISLSGRRSYIDIILNALLKDNEDFSFTVAPRYYDSQIQFSYNPNKRNRFLLPVVFSNDELAFVIGNPPEDGAVIRGNIKNSTEFTMISPHYTYFSPSGWSNRISANIGRNMFFFNLTEDYKFDLDVKRYDIRNEISLPQVHKGTLILGVDSKTGDYEVEVSLPRPNNPAEVFTPITTREIIHQDVKGTSTIFSFYSQWERSFDRLSIVPGLRFSWFSSLSETTIEPRFSMKYKLSDPTTLKMAAGWFYRQPDDVEIDEVFGNPDLRTERSRQLVVGVERDLNKLGLLDLQLFYNALDHLAVEDDEKNYTSNGKGRIWGLELLHRFPEKGKVTGWLSYTLSRSERKDVRTGRYYVHNYDQTHIVSLLASYHLSASWKLGTRVRYVTGNPYTPVKNAFFDSDNDVYIPTSGSFHSERNTPFFQTDLRVDWLKIFQSWQINFYLEILNVTNSENVEAKRYSFDYKDRTDVKGLPVIPTIGFFTEF